MKTGRKCLMTIIVFSLLLVFASTAISGNDYTVDPVHSSLVFGIKHFGASMFYGRINSPAGKLVFDEENPKNSMVEISVNAGDVDTASEKRDKHIKSAEFFNIKNCPLISFKSTNVKKISEKEYQVEGGLTFLGKTRTIKIVVQYIGSGKDPWGGYRSGFESRFTIKRSDFGMDFMMGPIGDEVQIIISIEAVRD
jgi:polyisoprenoid-binding protein YceI